MKLKYPKKVKIGHNTFKMIYDKYLYGGSFCMGTKYEIIIGTKPPEEDIFMVICHELMEAICVQNANRYDDRSVEDNYKFFMDHKEFDNNIAMFSDVVKNFIN